MASGYNAVLQSQLTRNTLIVIPNIKPNYTYRTKITANGYLNVEAPTPDYGIEVIMPSVRVRVDAFVYAPNTIMVECTNVSTVSSPSFSLTEDLILAINNLVQGLLPDQGYVFVFLNTGEQLALSDGTLVEVPSSYANA